MRTVYLVVHTFPDENGDVKRYNEEFYDTVDEAWARIRQIVEDDSLLNLETDCEEDGCYSDTEAVFFERHNVDCV